MGSLDTTDEKMVYTWAVSSKYFPNKLKYDRNHDIIGKLVEQEIFLRIQILVKLIQAGVINDQSFEF